MTDLTERLRDACGNPACRWTLNEAADEIDRLRAALRQIYFLDHNEREWESIQEIKDFARAALRGEGE